VRPDGFFTISLRAFPESAYRMRSEVVALNLFRIDLLLQNFITLCFGDSVGGPFPEIYLRLLVTIPSVGLAHADDKA